MSEREIPTVVCAWCDRTVRDAGVSVSHGICGDCRRRVEERAQAGATTGARVDETLSRPR